MPKLSKRPEAHVTPKKNVIAMALAVFSTCMKKMVSFKIPEKTIFFFLMRMTIASNN